MRHAKLNLRSFNFNLDYQKAARAYDIPNEI